MRPAAAPGAPSMASDAGGDAGSVPVLPDHAQVLSRAGRGAALSHESAAAAWSIELLDASRRRITVPRNRSRLQLPGWEVVRADLAADEVIELSGTRLTTALRTVHDLCRVLPFAQALVAADAALRLGLVPVVELVGSLACSFGRGSARLRRVGASVDPGSGSVLETLLRALLLDAVPPGVSQHEIFDPSGHFVARVDLCWPPARLVVEADGYAFHSDRAAYRRDRERLNELERLGWRVLRFSWEDVVGRPEHVVAVIRDCLRAGR